MSVDSAIIGEIHQAEQAVTNLPLEKAQRLKEKYFNEDQEKMDHRDGGGQRRRQSRDRSALKKKARKTEKPPGT